MRKKRGEQKEAGRLLETLERWGVRNLQALAALPEIALSERLGQEGLRLQRLARGASSRTLALVEAPAVFEEAIELEFPIVLLEPLAFLLNRLLDQICARLAARALNTQELRLTLELENFSSRNQQSGISNQQNSPNQFQRTLRLPLPMLDAKLFLKLLQLDLNAHPPGAPIKKIHLVAEAARAALGAGEACFCRPRRNRQKSRSSRWRASPDSWASPAWDRQKPFPDTHRAEGFRMQRFAAGITSEREQKKVPAKEKSRVAVAALRRFRPPLRAAVTFENGELVRLACSKKKEVQGSVLWEGWPVAEFGRLVGARGVGARRVGHLLLQTAEEVALYRLVHDLLGGEWLRGEGKRAMTRNLSD